MNSIFTIAGIGIVSTAFVIILKQYRPEFAFGAALAAGIILLFFSVSCFTEIIKTINDFIDISNAGKEKYEILIKCLGICMVTKIASETCKDCGENSIASKIDLAGKAVVLTFSMPLFQEVIFIIKDLLEL
ncbi:MAG: stage III sporulation AC/AD family protein [Oscillospiraceae bacterium]|nr:stage III sporulation AC/AD family protein [Oscillospiraceae bacterium]MBQ8788854.1 stage III sporulation AC/AD family protein [Oscillospiraceae bacterium]